MISDGRIAPGEHLLEAHIARAFGISRSPARHALEALAEMKVIKPNVGRGYVVGKLQKGDAEKVVAKLDEQEVVSLAGWESVYKAMADAISRHVVYCSVRVKEEQAAAHFGVGRTVVRDALMRLNSAGILEKNRQGRWVAQKVTVERIRDIYFMRALLEPVALTMAVAEVDARALRRMESSLVEAVKEPSKLNSQAHLKLEQGLHIQLLASCTNKELLKALHQTHLFISSHSMFDLGFTPADVKVSLKGHLRVVRSMLSGNHLEASEHLRAHIVESCDIWVSRFVERGELPQIDMPGFLTSVE